MIFSIFLKDSRMAITSITRNTSCSKGWLPLVVHVIFGTLIVASFILIMLMTMSNAYRAPGQSSRCNVMHCTVKCTEAPFYGDFEEDIINAVAETVTVCKSISLVLAKPNFKNSMMPKSFLSRLRPYVQELTIEGGNLKSITPHAFLSPYSNNLQSLIFKQVQLTTWKHDTFLGLSTLKTLVIRDCILLDIKENALQAVADTLEVLNIKANIFWSPVNITGSANLNKLRTVNFSINMFYNVLNNDTFTKLKHCKVLYLNSCKITFLGPGTFDFLDSLELLYLNNNYLVTIPNGLFDKVLTQPIRIALHDNFWFCDCSRDDLNSLHKQGILVIDLICHYPDEVNGLTLGDFEEYCLYDVFLDKNVTFSKALFKYTCDFTPDVIQINETCHSKNNLAKSFFPRVAPELTHVCSSNTINSDILEQITNKNEINTGKSNWLKPVFSIQDSDYTMIKIAISGFYGSGLLWYQSSCEDTVYCINVVPEIIKLYSVNIDLNYTFCPYNITSGLIETLHCVSYNLADFEREYMAWYETRIYILLSCGSLICLSFGATCVYAIIQKNPNLLKGNKRVVLVKHKTFDAIVLPPEIPIRKTNLSDTDLDQVHNNDIYMLPQSNQNLSPQEFTRSMSMLSDESNDASYVSALQPTDEQLFEWRNDQNVNKLALASTSDGTISTLSSIDVSIPYYSLKSDSKIYETVK